MKGWKEIGDKKICFWIPSIMAQVKQNVITLYQGGEYEYILRGYAYLSSVTLSDFLYY